MNSLQLRTFEVLSDVSDMEIVTQLIPEGYQPDGSCLLKLEVREIFDRLTARRQAPRDLTMTLLLKNQHFGPSWFITAKTGEGHEARLERGDKLYLTVYMPPEIPPAPTAP